MKTLLVGLTLLFTGLVFADTEHNIRVNRIEMKAAAPDESDDQDAQSEDAPATDYNSSRSNKADSVVLSQEIESGDESGGTRATDYNSSRSNKADSKTAEDVDDSNDESDNTKATDYNSSRSNKSFSAVPVDECGDQESETADRASP